MSSPVSSRKLSKTFWIVVPALAIAVMSLFSPEPLFRFDGLRNGLSSMNEETFKALFFGTLFFLVLGIGAFFEKRRREGLKLVAQELGFTFHEVSDSPKRLINDPWVLLSQLSKNRTGHAKNVFLDGRLACHFQIHLSRYFCGSSCTCSDGFLFQESDWNAEI